MVRLAHSLAETFNTLTGYFHVPNDLASEMVASLTVEMNVEAMSQRDYLQVIRDAKCVVFKAESSVTRFMPKWPDG